MDRCVSCGAPLSGAYCAQCGERRPDRSQLKISTFLHRTFEEVADFEHSKLIRTLRILFLRPGYLTTEFVRGAVKPYIGPVKLYVTAFALSIFLYSIYRPAALYDVRSFMARDPGWHKRITAIAQKRHATEEQMLFEVNARWQKYLYFSEIVYPVALATGLALLYVRRRRFYVEHLIFALPHFGVHLSDGSYLLADLRDFRDASCTRLHDRLLAQSHLVAHLHIPGSPPCL